MGAVNIAFEFGLMAYIKMRHKKITEEERDARQDFWMSSAAVQQIEERLEEWTVEASSSLHDIDAEIGTLKTEEASQSRRHPSSFHPLDLRTSQLCNMNGSIETLKAQRTSLRETDTNQKTELKEAKAAKALSKKQYIAIRKKRSKADLEMRQKIDECLKNNGIDRCKPRWRLHWCGLLPP